MIFRKRFPHRLSRWMLSAVILTGWILPITDVPPAQAEPVNLLSNPGFESGSSSWETWSGTQATFHIDMQNPHTGGKAAAVTSSSAGNGGLWAQSFSVGFAEGDHIYAAAYAKCAGLQTSSGGAKISITGRDAAGNTTSPEPA